MSWLAGRHALWLRSLRWLPALALAGPHSTRTTADLIEEQAARSGPRVFVRFEGRSLTYSEYNAAANRIAHWAIERGLGRGDVVGLLMENRPEYLTVWAGFAKAGVTTALLNSNLGGKALAHAIDAAGVQLVVLGGECAAAWQSLGDDTPPNVDVFVATDPGSDSPPVPLGAKSFDDAVAGRSVANPPASVRSPLRGRDSLFYIYTSGTTGLPKAARFNHARFLGGGTFGLLAGFDRDDTLYCPLPLYHTVGSVMSVCTVLRSGGTLALRRKFSASQFWRDVVEMDATAFQYIGELCRYLLAQPRSEWEGRHRIRFCVGNGLRADIWEAFRERFQIPLICEFYGATESNVALVNLEGRVGSVGRQIPGTQVALIRYDVTHSEHPRDARNRCIPCRVGEPGELLGKISTGLSGIGHFEGYTSKAATEKKILRNVFRAGDAWFRTGDLLCRDRDGYYTFVDRIGDTFRWKGENVSTQEVADALTAFQGVELCAVYGVPVPETDGAVGMAAIVPRAGVEIDPDALFEHLEKALPAYARPGFLRIQRSAEITATFKLRKVDLQRQGFDPKLVDDPLLCRIDEERSFVPLTPELYEQIGSGRRRL